MRYLIPLAVLLAACGGGDSEPSATAWQYRASVGGRSYTGTARIAGDEWQWQVDGYGTTPAVIAEVSASDWQILAFPTDVSGFYVHHIDVPRNRCTVRWTRAPNDFVTGSCSLTPD
jgi:hypothetical protein